MFRFLRKHNWTIKTRKNEDLIYKCRKCGRKIKIDREKKPPKRGCRGKVG